MEIAEPNNVSLIGTAKELEETKSQNRNNKELFVYGFTSKDYQQPCTIMSKMFRKLSVDTKFKETTAFFEMDVDNFQDLARQYKLDVYPAFLLLNPKDNDKEVGRVTGVNPGKLESSIKEALNQKKQQQQQAPPPAAVRRNQALIDYAPAAGYAAGYGLGYGQYDLAAGYAGGYAGGYGQYGYAGGYAGGYGQYDLAGGYGQMRARRRRKKVR